MVTAVSGMFFNTSALRRVRKDEVAAPTFLKPDALDVCLDRWKQWMSLSDTDLGMKSVSSMYGATDGFGNDDTAQMRRDNEIAEATNAMILSLQRSHQWAIRRKCGVTRGHVWQFPNLDFVTEAELACQALEEKLKKNTATRLLF